MMFDLSSSHRVRRGLALVLALLPLVALSGCAAVMASLVKAERDESRSFTVAGRPAVVVDTFNGEIKVERGSQDRVDAVVTKTGSGSNQQAAEKDLENVKVEFSQEGDTIRVVATRTGPMMFGSSGASVALRVPAEATLALTTRNGKIETEGIRGDLVARTSNGEIDVDGGMGELDLQTSNGAIEIDATEATVAAESTNGNVSFAGSLARGSHKLETSNGGIDLKLPASTPFRFEASTSNGSVTNRFPGLQPTSGKKGSRRLAGVVGQAEAAAIDVKLETSNGSITIEPLQPAEVPGR